MNSYCTYSWDFLGLNMLELDTLEIRICLDQKPGLKDVTTMSKLPLMAREKPQSPAGRRVFGVRASHGEAKNCRCRRWVGPSPSSCDAQFLWKRRLGPSMEEPWLDNQTTSNNVKPHLGAQHGHVFFHGVLRISFLKQFRRKA